MNERFRLGDLLGFGDTLGERMPWHHRFDRLERVAARFLGLQKRAADLRELPNLVVDRFPGQMELQLVLFLRDVE